MDCGWVANFSGCAGNNVWNKFFMKIFNLKILIFKNFLFFNFFKSFTKKHCYCSNKYLLIGQYQIIFLYILFSLFSCGFLFLSASVNMHLFNHTKNIEISIYEFVYWHCVTHTPCCTHCHPLFLTLFIIAICWFIS